MYSLSFHRLQTNKQNQPISVYLFNDMLPLHISIMKKERYSSTSIFFRYNHVGMKVHRHDYAILVKRVEWHIMGVISLISLITRLNNGHPNNLILDTK